MLLTGVMEQLHTPDEIRDQCLETGHELDLSPPCRPAAALTQLLRSEVAHEVVVSA